MGEQLVKVSARVTRIETLPETLKGLRPCRVTSEVLDGPYRRTEVTDTIADCSRVAPGLRVSVMVRAVKPKDGG